jgi:hypothetical protein
MGGAIFRTDLGAMMYSGADDQREQERASAARLNLPAPATDDKVHRPGKRPVGGLRPNERKAIERRIASLVAILRDLEVQLQRVRQVSPPPDPGSLGSPSSGPRHG